MSSPDHRAAADAEMLRTARGLSRLAILGICSGDDEVIRISTAIQKWMAVPGGPSLEDLIGVRPAPGSKRTIARLVRRRRLAGLMAALVRECGSIAAAARALRLGEPRINARTAPMINDLARLGCPRNERSIRRLLSGTRPDIAS